jgi:chemosensory pili system protein ChpA (sensor histidine kinase/response regulator)
VQVDEVLGNREVVIKNIGPQLARMIGIAGATVLGSGEIVLILNPVALAHHMAQHPAEAEGRLARPAGRAEPARTWIMVVDDSLTVRKVTQRLLEREGYHRHAGQGRRGRAGTAAGHRVPDLMLVDIEMPRMDGFDLTRNIRGDDARGHPDHHDHLAQRRQAPQLRAGAGRECLLRQAVPGAYVLLGAIAGLLNARMPS